MIIRRMTMLALGAFLTALAHADTVVPRGMGTAAWWVTPCELFERQVSTQKPLTGAQLAQAALCQGYFTALISVNYIDPPYLPFCVGDNDASIDFARAFLAFMRSNPGYADKNMGLAVLVALGRARPKEQCARVGR